jgi:hypothetical protein
MRIAAWRRRWVTKSRGHSDEKPRDGSRHSVFTGSRSREAEKRGYPGYAKLDECILDEMEHELLRAFFESTSKLSREHFVHWNMRNHHYGFAALEQRFDVLRRKQKPNARTRTTFKPSQRINLAEILPTMYGERYCRDRDRILTLAEKNGLTFSDAIAGHLEPSLLREARFREITTSTTRKVEIIGQLLERAWNGSLKSESTIVDVYGSKLLGYLEHTLKSTWARAAALVLGAYGLVSAAWQAIAFVF